MNKVTNFLFDQAIVGVAASLLLIYFFVLLVELWYLSSRLDGMVSDFASKADRIDESERQRRWQEANDIIAAMALPVEDMSMMFSGNVGERFTRVVGRARVMIK